MPSGPVHQDNAVCFAGDLATDLIEVHLHGFGVGEWHHQCRTFSSRRADGSEEIGILIALISRQTGPRAGLCPKPGTSILLAKPGFVLEPDFHRRAFR